MTGEPEPTVPEREARLSGPDKADDAPRTDPISAPPSSVNASAPTLQGDSRQFDSDATRPVVIRTPLPPAALDEAVGALVSTTTPTGAPARISTTMRSGGGRTLVGQTLGRYEIVQELGHGGMATVYRARDPRLERDVALKVIHRHLRDNDEIAQRFRHEARAVAKLKHPSIVEIYDVPDETEDDERFLVAELVEGPSLRKYLQELRKELGEEHPGLFPPELAAALILQVLGALGRAHEEGIVHRDVKPENILIAHGAAKNGPRSSEPSNPGPDRPSPTSLRVPTVAKLTDFGIAKILDAQSMTSTGQILGSPAHMAPEQIEAGEIGPRVDVFATGVLFYELLTGILPFDGKNPAQVIRRVLEGQFTPADRVVPQVGGRWSAIVATMLAREPERRPADARACEDAIRKELEAMGVVDPDRELLDFMRDPKAVASGWGARLKPRLLERAMAAREAGDVVGSAHDLNRALAYDPSDPKLIRAVSTMRSRERRLRGLRRTVPLGIAALVVTVGTFGIVRWSRTHPAVAPSASATITPVPKASSATVALPPSASVVPSAKPSIGPVVSAIASTVLPPPTAPAADAAAAASGKTRGVTFTFYPSISYFTIDNGPKLDPLKEQHQELSVGKHTLAAVGQGGCCEPYSTQISIEPGEGDIPNSHHKLNFASANVFVQGIDGTIIPGAIITAKAEDGRTWTGKGSITIPMSVPRLENVSFTFEAGGKSFTTSEIVKAGNPLYLKVKD